MWTNVVYSDELYHYGVKGMKWGVRKRYLNSDGSLNDRGVKKYARKGYAQDSYNSNSTRAGKIYDMYTGAHKTSGKIKYDVSSKKQNRERAEQYLNERNKPTPSTKNAKPSKTPHKDKSYLGQTADNAKMYAKGRAINRAGRVMQAIGQQQYSQYKNGSTRGRTAVINILGYGGSAMEQIGGGMQLGSLVSQGVDTKRRLYR